MTRNRLYSLFPKEHLSLGYHHPVSPPATLHTQADPPITQFLRAQICTFAPITSLPTLQAFVLPTLASCLPNTSPTHGFIILFPTFFTQKKGRSSENHASQEMGGKG